MSYFKGRNKIHRNTNNNNEILRRNSRVRIDQNILNYLYKVNEKTKLKKIASLKDSKFEKIATNTYNGMNDNIHIDFERKNKARRSLLYLLNKMSGGTFCPQIIDYFKEIKELKKKEEQLKEVKEEDVTEDQPSINPSALSSKKIDNNNYIKKNSNILSNYITGQGKNNYPNYKFTKRNVKYNNINEEKSVVSKHYTKDFGIKDLEKFIDSEEIERMNANKFNFNKEAQAKKKFLEEMTIDEDDRYYQKKARKNEKKKYKENDEFNNNNIEDNIEKSNEGIESFKKLSFPSLKKLNRLNRMNTVSGGGVKKNNFINDKSNYLNNYNVSSEIKEERGDNTSLNYKKFRKNYI